MSESKTKTPSPSNESKKYMLSKLT